MVGCYKTMPVLIAALMENGLTYTACTNPSSWYLMGPSGLWTTLFVYSKIPELLDTVFLVLQKKRVIFLHW
jgi:elongation of very long chain fatty acids protein 6